MCRDCKSEASRRARVSPALRQEIFDRDGHRCQHCGSAESLTIDHIVPTSLGGDSAPENLQVLCLSCNSRKGDRPNSDYAKETA